MCTEGNPSVQEGKACRNPTYVRSFRDFAPRVSVATLERWMSDARLEAVITTAAMDETQRSAWCRK